MQESAVIFTGGDSSVAAIPVTNGWMAGTRLAPFKTPL